jgi:HlyD family secretion protein
MSQRNISGIARSEAVAQMSSVEQLDRRLVVISRSSWVLLVVAGLLTTICIGWGLVGRIPDVVEGEGVLAPLGTQPVEVSSPSAYGGVVELIAPEGEMVEIGDPLVRIHNRELELAVEAARSELDLLKDQDDRLTAAEDRILQQRKVSLEAQLAAAKEITEQTRSIASLLAEEIENLEALVKDRLIPQSELVTAEQNHFSALQQITRQETIVTEAQADYESLLTSTEQARLARAGGIATAESRLATAETRMAASTLVVAPIAGEVLEHMVDLGSSVAVGADVVSIRPAAGDDAGIEGTAYVPYGVGRRIRPGMAVQASLPFARPSKYGYVVGRVVSVSTYVSSASASVHLGSRVLADQLTRRLGPMLEVRIAFEEDSSTPTGLRWTSGRGYLEEIEFPALCGIRVLVAENRPIDLVLPWIKDVLGLDPPVGVLEEQDG